MVGLHIFPFLVFAIAEIGAHTGYGKIFIAAVQRGKAVVLTGDKPPVFIKGRLDVYKRQAFPAWGFPARSAYGLSWSDRSRQGTDLSLIHI